MKYIFGFFVILYSFLMFLKGHIYECKKKGIAQFSIGFINMLVTIYAVLSPFILKDYWYNLIFNIFMFSSWFIIEKYYTGEKMCMLEHFRDTLCENTNFSQNINTPIVLYMTFFIIIYDIIMILKSR